MSYTLCSEYSIQSTVPWSLDHGCQMWGVLPSVVVESAPAVDLAYLVLVLRT